MYGTICTAVDKRLPRQTQMLDERVTNSGLVTLSGFGRYVRSGAKDRCNQFKKIFIFAALEQKM